MSLHHTLSTPLTGLSTPTIEAGKTNALIELLGERKAWLTWAKAFEDGKHRKVPKRLVDENTLVSFNPKNARYLNTYETAKKNEQVAISHGLDGEGGIGISPWHLSDIQLIDLDHCIEDGVITNAPISKFVETANTYTELSPSSTGLRLAFIVSDGRSTEKSFNFKRPIVDERRDDVNIQTNCMFYTFTGNVFRDLPVRAVKNAELVKLYAIVGVYKEEELPLPPTPVWPVPMEQDSVSDDEALIERVRTAKNGWKFSLLYDAGDWKAAGYPSHSDADEALCGILVFWTSDAERIDRIFRTSKLMRPKWDEKRPPNSTYGWNTIKKATESPHDAYTGLQKRSAFGPIKVISDLELQELNIPDVDWLIEPLIAKETLNMLAAPSHQFKSWGCMHTAICVAHGRPLFNRFATSKSNVLYVSEEDTLAENKKRYRMLLQEGEQPGGVHFVIDSGRKIDKQWAEEIVQIAKDRSITFVILDSLRSLHSEKESDSDGMQKVVDSLRVLTRNGLTVLFTHHHRKGQSGNSDEMENEMDKARGSSGIPAAMHGHITFAEKNIGDHYLVVRQVKLKSGKKLPPFIVYIREDEERGKLWFECGDDYDPDAYAIEAKKKRLLKHFQENQEKYLTRKNLVDAKCATDTRDKTLISALNKIIEKGEIQAVAFGDLSKKEQKKVQGKNAYNTIVYRLASHN